MSSYGIATMLYGFEEKELPAAPFDLAEHLARQRAFSERTFGPGRRTRGICEHIRRETREVEAAPLDFSEWADLQILAFDGALRTGATPQEIIAALVNKQTENEGRTWPPHQSEDLPVEHDRAAAPQVFRR